jgi:hypothetical protein
MLFEAAVETLTTIAGDPKHLGAKIGLTAVLHTWGQTLTHHPHLHCIVPGGGLSADGSRWVSSRPGFFLPERVLSRLFRRLFLTKLVTSHRRGRLHFFSDLAELAKPAALSAYLAPLRRTAWVVDSKRPFAGPQQVLRYLSGYTHRVAIANHRLVDIADGRITFTWKDYRHAGRLARMTLAAHEFIRRFLLHVLPDSFPRIRHYGFLANSQRRTQLARIRQLLAPPPQPSISPLKPADSAVKPVATTSVADQGRPCPLCRSIMAIIHILPGPSRPPTRRSDTS